MITKKLKFILMGTIILIGVGAFAGCKSTEGGKEENKTTEKIEENFKYTYSDGKTNLEVDVTKKPTRAVTLSQFMTEMLLSLGLEKSMVGTALLDNPILPQYKEAYDKIPVLKIAEGHNISKEAFMALEPDFVGGWQMSISNESTGSAEELLSEGIYPFMAKSISGDATINTVYEDYRTIGKIFDVENQANVVIRQMQNEISEVEEKVKSKNERVKVMVYDSGEKEAMVVGGGLPNNLITIAGGDNIYGDLKNAYENVSFESMVAKNPDVIVLTDYLTGPPVEKKMEFLKSNPALKDINAIKNNRIYVIELADIEPGIRNASAITKLHKMFYENSN